MWKFLRTRWVALKFRTSLGIFVNQKTPLVSAFERANPRRGFQLFVKERILALPTPSWRFCFRSLRRKTPLHTNDFIAISANLPLKSQGLPPQPPVECRVYPWSQGLLPHPPVEGEPIAGSQGFDIPHPALTLQAFSCRIFRIISFILFSLIFQFVSVHRESIANASASSARRSLACLFSVFFVSILRLLSASRSFLLYFLIAALRQR